MTAARPVAIVGMGLAVPQASSPGELWDVLNQDRPVFARPDDRYRLDSFYSPSPDAPDRCHVPVAGYLTLDPHPGLRDVSLAPEQQGALLLRHCLLQACENVTIGERCAFFVGAFPDGLQQLEQAAVAETVQRGMAARRVPGTTATRQDSIGSRIRRHYGHHGTPPRDLLPDRLARTAAAGLLPVGCEVAVVDAACASALYAVDLGVSCLLEGSSDLALCGGLFVLGPRYTVLFGKLSGLSPAGRVRAFDEAADGTLFSDGAAVVALKRLPDAIAAGDEILGVIAGIGTSADGRGKAIYAPNANGQRLCLARARAAAGTAPEEIDWVVAHGTGTPAGDGVELSVLEETAPARGLPVTSSKSLIGHTGWSAGAVSLIHALLALGHGRIPPQAQVDRPAVTGNVSVPTEHVDWPGTGRRPRTAGVSAFGFGGANAHVIVQEYLGQGTAPAPATRADDPVVLIAWTAHLPESRTFGGYPPLTFEEARMAPPAVRCLDRSQQMALRTAAMFAEEHGELWDKVRETTGVIAATMGPTRASLDNLVRCYADDLRTMEDLPRADREALESFLSEALGSTPPSASGTLPGIMPNVLAARIAARYDLHGAALSVDTGRSGGLTAVRAACRFLRSGELDLALVLAASAASGPDYAEIVSVPAGRIAEGAYLLALARRSTAGEHGWPELATIAVAAHQAATVVTCGERDGGTLLAADGLAEIARAVKGDAPTLITSPETDPGPAVLVTPNAARAVLRTFVRAFRQAPASAWNVSRGERNPLSPQSVVLTTSDLAQKLEGLVRPVGIPVVTPDSPTAGWRAERILLVASFHGIGWPEPRADELLALHELAFRACSEHREDLARGSYQQLLLDPMTAGRPHPYSGLFSGFARALSWDLPDCTVFTLATDAEQLDTGLRQMGVESRLAWQGPEIRITKGQRQAEVFMASPLPAAPALPPPEVVVAAGGARGITAPLLLDLARAHRPKIWLLGSASLDRAASPPTVAKLLKSDPTMGVKEAGRVVAAARNAGQAAATVNALRDLCGAARVTYLTCDITDAAAVKRAAGEIRAASRHIDLLIHAAGLNRSGELGSKRPSDFRAVRDTKVVGYLNLKAAFRDPAPGRWCNFGSALGAIGYPGECDYAAANAFLADAAGYEQDVRDTHEQTLAWGLWGETGMGSGAMSLARTQRLGLLTPMSTAEGVRHFRAVMSVPARNLPELLYLGERELSAIRARRPGVLQEGVPQ